MSQTLLPTLGALALLLGPAEAQQPPTFSSGVDLVRLGVSVRDPRGRFQRHLTASDFEVREEGVAQRITSFNQRSGALTVVLLLDLSASMEERLAEVQDAASRFARTLQPDDLMRVAEFKDRLTVRQDFTSDPARLEQAIRSTRAFGATALHNALYSAIRTLRGRRAEDELRRQIIVVLSDGEDNASAVNDDQVLDLARRSDVSLYAISLRPRNDDGAEPSRAVSLLAALTHETGGELLRPKSVDELERVYGQIAEELRAQYSLGYVSSTPATGGSWRRVDVRVPTRRGARVQHRLGYYAKRTDWADAADSSDRAPSESGQPRPMSDAGPPAPDEAVAAKQGPLRPWLTSTDDALEMVLLQELEDGELSEGLLHADRLERRVVWRPSGASDPRGEREILFEEIAAVSRLERGRFELELRRADARSWVFLPESPVRARHAVRALLEALGREPTTELAVLEAFYGPPVRIALPELLDNLGTHEGRAVRLRGRLVRHEREAYSLCSSTSARPVCVNVAPEHRLRALVSSRSRDWQEAARTLEIDGVLRRRAPGDEDQANHSPSYVRFWNLRALESESESQPLTPLETLVAAAGALDGRPVRVVGYFRGANLYADLPIGSRWHSDDWILQDGGYAVWITGQTPSGAGWRLDFQSARDTASLLEVVGQPRTRGGHVYLQASAVWPANPATATASNPRRTTIKTYDSPVVSFAWPEAGEPIGPGTQFVLQFSSAMDSESFDGRVELRYADAPREASASPTRLTYDDARRALVIDPGEALDVGRRVECRLLTGIRDAEGRLLRPRRGTEQGGVVETLLFDVVPGG